jgi:hypothetical protein
MATKQKTQQPTTTATASTKEDVKPGMVVRDSFDAKETTKSTGAREGTLEGTLQKGGWKAGIIGGLLGAGRFVTTGGDTKQEQGFGYIQGIREDLGDERRDQETQQADQLIKYADLQQKILELDDLDRKSEVSRWKQAGAVAGAKSESASAEASFAHIGTIIEGEKAKIFETAQKNINDANDQELTFFEENSGNPNLTTSKGFETVLLDMRRSGIDPTKFNIPEKWEPGMANLFKGLGHLTRASRNTAAATASREDEQSHAKTIEGIGATEAVTVARINAASAERITKMQEKTDRLKNDADARKTDNIKTSNEQMGRPENLKNKLVSVTKYFTSNAKHLMEKLNSKEADDVVSDMSNMAERLQSDHNNRYNNGTVKRAMSWDEALDKAGQHTYSRVTSEGDYFPSGDPEELRKDREAFTKAAKNNPIISAQIQKYIAEYPNDEQLRAKINSYLRGVYGDPEARGFAPGTEEFIDY